jgi:hypothetical protein
MLEAPTCEKEQRALIVEGATSLPVRYNPERGLADIAMAEIGERYFERAKDPARLFEAIEIKITRQAEYVVWRDAQPKNKGGRGHRTDCSSATVT